MRSRLATPTTRARWTRQRALPAVALLTVTALAWAYTLWSPSMSAVEMGSSTSMEMAGSAGMSSPAELLLFLVGWAVMMVAMMLPSASPLVLLYRATARRKCGERKATAGMVALLSGYLAIWTVAGLPVYAYQALVLGLTPLTAALPGALLIAGGLYQFTALKRRCQSRCSSPWFFLLQQWRPGVSGAARLGVLHGRDCLGCCAGLMLALVGLGMMNIAWMLSAAVIVFVEKTMTKGDLVARPLGVALVSGGVVVLVSSAL